ncbi:uncharacterized protein LOC143465469 [Clavelina lepadiformis]|uniref:Sodefrin-like factor n=1 Tax=Clavelina lepadiformis TaxID=159417 RepID=A0ABP0EWF4_CLALP
MKHLCGVFMLVVVIQMSLGKETTNTASMLQCIQGFKVNDVSNFTDQNCGLHETTCETQLVKNGDLLVMYKRCKEAEACKNNAKNNDAICYGPTSKINKVQVCHFCCTTDFCNTLETIPEAPSSVPANTLEGSA